MTDAALTPPTLNTLRTRRDAILRLAERYGASNVRVFGSVARGTASTDSDVDLLVSFPDNRSIFDLVGLWLDLKDELGCEVSLVADTSSDQDFVERISREAVPL